MSLALFGLLYVPFMAGPQIGLGMDRVVASIRFNGPVFLGIRHLTNPVVAAGLAGALGLTVAVWCRWRLPREEPAGWAWPMAVALACGPVIYLALLYFTPRIPSATHRVDVQHATVYLVWRLPLGKLWTVPFVVLIFENAASRWPVALAAIRTRLVRRKAFGEVEAPEHASCD